MKELYLPTGNEYVSLPDISERTATVGSFSCLHMGAKGLVEFHGADEPLIAPFASGAELTDFAWRRLGHWVPEFTARAGALIVRGTILAPVGERGFIFRLSLENPTDEAAEAEYGLRGVWGGARVCINESRGIRGEMGVTDSLWSSGPVFELSCALPFLAFAPMCDREISSAHGEGQADDDKHVAALGGRGYTLESFHRGVGEMTLEVEVTAGRARKHELGEHQQLRTLLRVRRDRLCDARGVIGRVGDAQGGTCRRRP